MQTLEVISVNLWNIIISLLNLLILYAIIKKFLYKPVNRVLKERQEQIDRQYDSARQAEKEALDSKEQWAKKLDGAKAQADDIMQTATENAGKRSEKIVAEAKEKADAIVRRAKEDADLELKKAEESIKHEIVNVSALLSEKMLKREINANDHRALIDSFIEEIGETDGANE